MKIPTQDEQASQFGHELDRLIDRFRDEYDISYAAMIGALYFRAHSLANELEEINQEEGEE